MSSLAPKQQKLVATLIIIAVALMVSSMDIYLPAMPIMRDYFKTSEYIMQLTMAVHPFSSAISGLIFGRFCDIYGRRLILMASFFFFLIGGLGCCFVDTIELFFVSRFIQAIGCGGLSVVGLAIIADLFHGVEYARYMSIYGSLFPFVFATSPILGSQMLEYFGWRSCFTLNVSAMLLVAITLYIILPETIQKGKYTSQGGFWKFLSQGKMLLGDGEFLLMSFGHALPVTLIGLFLASGSFIFIEGFGFSPTLFSLSQSIPLTLNFIGALTYRRFVRKLGLKGALQVGAIGMSGFCVGTFALMTHQLPNLPPFILGIFCLSNFATPFVATTCATRAMELFPNDRGLAASILGLLRNLLLGSVVSLAGVFFNGTILPVYMAMTLVVCIVLGIIFMALQRPLAFASK